MDGFMSFIVNFRSKGFAFRIYTKQDVNISKCKLHRCSVSITGHIKAKIHTFRCRKII